MKRIRPNGTRPYIHIDLAPLGKALSEAGDRSAAIKLWLAVTHQANVTRSPEVRVTSDLLRKFGAMSRKTKAAGIQFWKARGWWEVEQRSGKNPLIRIMHPPAKGSPATAPDSPARQSTTTAATNYETI